MGTPSLAASSAYILLAWAFVFGSCAGTPAQQAALSPAAVKAEQDKEREPVNPVQQPAQALARAHDSTDTKSPPASAQASAVPTDVIFTRDGFGASGGYKEYQLPQETQWLDTNWSLLPGQPTLGPEAVPPSDRDWADPPTGRLRQNGDWLGQPHGRVYYRASCQAARELPEPIYFESEEEAQLSGYQPSLVPGC
jgi:hypothetical protein